MALSPRCRLALTYIVSHPLSLGDGNDELLDITDQSFLCRQTPIALDFICLQYLQNVFPDTTLTVKRLLRSWLRGREKWDSGRQAASRAREVFKKGRRGSKQSTAEELLTNEEPFGLEMFKSSRSPQSFVHSDSD